MGIIRKQSIYSSLFIYLGFLIGAINVLILFPDQRFFTPQQFGLTRLLIDVSLLFATLCTIGSIPATIKFFPFYKSYLKEKENDLPALTIGTTLVGCLLFIAFASFFKDFIIRKFGSNSPLFVSHYHLIYPLTITFAFFMLFESYAWVARKTIASNFLKELLFRIITTILILLRIFNIIDIEDFLILFSCVYLPSTMILLLIIARSGSFSLNFSISHVTKRLYKRILRFALLLFSGAVLNVLSRTIDIIIIASQSPGGLTDAAIFTIPTYLVTIMDVPQRSIISIATPIISEAWKDRNLAKIREIYQKTSLNLLIIGLALGGAIYLNMDNAVRFLGDTYQPIKAIVLVMGIAKLIDLGTGLNSTILLLSKYWRIDFITNMCFVAMAIPLNYFLIRSFGVMGAAYANFISLTIFNLIRLFYIYKLFKLQPFSSGTVASVLMGLSLITLIHYLLPFWGNLYADSALRTVIYLVAFTAVIVQFKISPDINELVTIFLQKLKRIFS
jgi:O-antigen/teichoic acid export membrane protein